MHGGCVQVTRHRAMAQAAACVTLFCGGPECECGSGPGIVDQGMLTQHRCVCVESVQSPASVPVSVGHGTHPGATLC